MMLLKLTDSLFIFPKRWPTRVQMINPILFGALQQIYQYFKNMLSVALNKTNIDQILIDNTLATNNKCQVKDISQYSNIIQFPNTYECFLHPLNSKFDDIQMLLNPLLLEISFVINQKYFLMLIYILLADFGYTQTPETKTQQISYSIYDYILYSLQNDQCKCWGVDIDKRKQMLRLILFISVLLDYLIVFLIILNVQLVNSQLSSRIQIENQTWLLRLVNAIKVIQNQELKFVVYVIILAENVILQIQNVWNGTSFIKGLQKVQIFDAFVMSDITMMEVEENVQNVIIVVV
ncbi:unnamed protein product [Paramecium sonneborni]|uniref:Transmembrane protein n=1 Tax=Paramecium sonneborni TaxID=65129 RepID=A0A8S1RJJ6_9CILI|nr:unnamed protein product [Paramecium sonneborni]